MNAADANCVTLLIESADRRAMKTAASFLVPTFGASAALSDPQAIKRVLSRTIVMPVLGDRLGEERAQPEKGVREMGVTAYPSARIPIATAGS